MDHESDRRGLLTVLARGLKRLLEGDRALRIVGMVERTRASPGQLRRLRPHVVIVEGDAGIANLEGLEGMVGVAVGLKGKGATILTVPPIEASGPQELIEAIRTMAQQRGDKG